MAKLVRSVCVHCEAPTIYNNSKRVHQHRDGWTDRDGNLKGCPEQYPAIKMITLIEEF